MTTLSFTGHRPNKLTGYQATDWVRDRLAAIIHRAYKANYRQFICGGALGTDWIAAEEIAGLSPREYPDVELILALPFKGYNVKWPIETIERFEIEIEGQADEVVYICEPGYAPWKYQKRNEWMVNRGRVLVAVYDGSEGGTQNAVHYARQCDKRIYRIDPKTKTEGWM